MTIDPMTGLVILIVGVVALVFGRRNLDNAPIEAEDSDEG